MAKRKLNIELFKKLRTRFLRMRHPEHFNMESYAQKTDCGTAMCIAGHALQLRGYKIKFTQGFDNEFYPEFYSPKNREVDPDTAAQRELGLTEDQAYSLFYDFDIKTPAQAAERITQIIETGEV